MASVALQFILTIDEMIYKLFPPGLTQSMMEREYEIKKKPKATSTSRTTETKTATGSTKGLHRGCVNVSIELFLMVVMVFLYAFFVYAFYLGCEKSFQNPVAEIKAKFSYNRLTPR